MKRYLISPLSYPEQFRVTMVILNKDLATAAQEVINSFSFHSAYYCGVSQEDIAGADIQLMMNLETYLKNREIWSTNGDVEGIFSHLRYMHAIYMNPIWSQQDKIKLSDQLFSRCEQQFQKLFDFPKEVKTREGNPINLSFQFNLRCIQLKIEPQELLNQLLSDTVSIAQFKSFDRLQLTSVNADSPYIPTNLEQFKTEKINHQDYPDREIREKYEEQFPALHDSLKYARYHERLTGYGKYYRDWYRELKSYQSSAAKQNRKSTTNA